MKYLIEHMEPEMFDWCIIEYKHISKTVGRKNLVITNVTDKKKELEKYAQVYEKHVWELPFGNFCLLDPNAEQEFSTEDGRKFDYLVFGGILGDFPPKKRTVKLSEKIKAEKRNLGKDQMSTDNAVLATSLIVKGKKFADIPTVVGIEVEVAKGESYDFPFCYVLVDGKPFISEELIDYLKEHGF